MQNIPQPCVNNTFLEIYFLSVYIPDIYKFNLLSFAEILAETRSYFNKTRLILTLLVCFLNVLIIFTLRRQIIHHRFITNLFSNGEIEYCDNQL